MEKVKENAELKAVLYLMAYIYNKRNGILEDISFPTLYKSRVDEIKNDIIRNTNLDIDGKLTKDECLLIEIYLNTIVENSIGIENDRQLEDEISLLMNSFALPKDKLEKAEINITPNIRHELDFLGIPKSALSDFILSPEYTRFFKVEEIGNLLCTKTLTIRGRKKIIIYHLKANKKYGLILQYELINIFAVDFSKFKDMLSSPIRLFLYLIDQYGIDIELNGITKNLFLKVPRNKENKINIQIATGQFNTTFQQITSPNGNFIVFLYAINNSKYHNDYKKGLI